MTKLSRSQPEPAFDNTTLISTYINRHQRTEADGNSRVIHIEYDAIVWAYPKFETRPRVKKEWIRVTKESVEVSGFTANLSLAFDMCFFVGSEISRRNTQSNSNIKDRTSRIYIYLDNQGVSESSCSWWPL